MTAERQGITPPPVLGQDDLAECLRWAAFKMCGAGEHEDYASDAITMALERIAELEEALREIIKMYPDDGCLQWACAITARAALGKCAMTNACPEHDFDLATERCKHCEYPRWADADEEKTND